MTKRSAKLYRYQLPMDSGVVLRGKHLTERRGYVVMLQAGEYSGLGEIAPLSGLSAESPEQAAQQAQLALAGWVSGAPLVAADLFPSVAFGLSMVELACAGQLPVQGQFRTAPLLSGQTDTCLTPEHRIAKVKVGRETPAQDATKVNQLLSAYPDLTLRLDANRAWLPGQAQQFACHLTPASASRIVFIEEPCAQPQDSLAFSAASGLPLAWDETLQQAVKQPDFRLDDLSGAAAIVVKPSLIGSVQQCAALIWEAKASGMDAVISSSLESSLGLTQLARLSHWLLPESVPGLDTLNLFLAQLETPWPGSLLPVQRLTDQTLVWQS
ncbi:o-succinylbenzoate synthase [Photobacterium galatheae]|uniref:o-succinylbenzoate synthase n=1 Tax=Photobacterium galatheae TaxID=1654360 RepID=A0A066RW65_9GAMM|nr:o-succinylbenzoate synthase [Photobacterium galatheae]KDM93351.1 O-succinylbenzoate synthase [Photobacterium galatheae]MCM0150474.1 o-succinylbenzoate synthase [Photobacterium galatheae]